MKFLIPATFFALGFLMDNSAHAAGVNYPTSVNHVAQRRSVADYCTESRFQSYIDLAKSMRDYVTPEEYGSLYVPLKIKAAKALITLKNYGPLSTRSHNSLLEIVRFVNRNEAKFNALWEVEAFFDVAQDLMDMTQSLTRDLE